MTTDGDREASIHDSKSAPRDSPLAASTDGGNSAAGRSSPASSGGGSPNLAVVPGDSVCHEAAGRCRGAAARDVGTVWGWDAPLPEAGAVRPAAPGFARATTGTGFRAVMANAAAALSLVNTVLEAASPPFPRIGALTAADPTLPLGARSDDGGFPRNG
jgi:hypothetical protein